MQVRVLLFTGKGGVGKTTIAAATAALAAADGRKTLVVSTDPAHSLADALGHPVGGEITEVDGALAALQVDTQRAFEHSWRAVQSYVLSLLDASGIDPVEAEELTVLPGAEEVLALLAVRDAARTGDFDLICVDCAPTAGTVRLLRLPAALRWWLDRLYPMERRLARSLLGRGSSVPAPNDAVLAAVTRLESELTDVHALVTDPAVSSVRLVLTAEQVVVAEARRARTALTLHGYRVDGVVTNRVFPAGGLAWQQGWAAAQRVQLDTIANDFAGLAQWQAAYAVAEPIGLEQLRELGAAMYRGADPAGPPTGSELLRVAATADGFALHVCLPFATRDAVALTRHGDELFVTVDDQRRILVLPSALRRCLVVGARLTGGELVVRFEPDPELWMRS